MNIFDYKTYIFDFDGVILDSNFIKKNAISKSVTTFIDDIEKIAFVEYFISNSGLPREKKIRDFFSIEDTNKILKKYENYLNIDLYNADFVLGVIKFITLLKDKSKDILILSGGDQNEIIRFLEYNKLSSLFNEVYGSPKSKHENLKSINLTKPVIFFGDSEQDYKVSVDHGLDFIFVSDYTIINNWKHITKNWIIKKEIKNFNSL